jgi:hypothetical protein
MPPDLLSKTLAHNLAPTAAGWRCRVCQWTWKGEAQGDCPGVPRYAPDVVPPELQTKSQLRAAGLQPGGPAQGCYYVSHPYHWRWLYAVSEACARPSLTAQQQAQQDRTWAEQQSARVARQARTMEED